MSCLCPTPYDLQSHEQKKEGERFSYEVCDSKHCILYLADPPTELKAQYTPSLIPFACLDQADSEAVALYLPLPAAAPLSHKPTGAPGEWGPETVPREQAAGILPLPLPTIQKNIQG